MLIDFIIEVGGRRIERPAPAIRYIAAYVLYCLDHIGHDVPVMIVARFEP